MAGGLYGLLKPATKQQVFPSSLTFHMVPTGQGKPEEVYEFDWSGKMQNYLESQGKVGK